MTDNSDVSAKKWYINKLEKGGYKILEGKHPVDIVAEKGGVKYYFELKSQNKTRRTNSDTGETKYINPYVGGISLEQLKCALEHEEHFRLVFLIKGQKANEQYTYYCEELRLKDFLPHLSGNWKITHNFSFKLKNPSTNHPEILENENSLDAEAVKRARREIKELSEILNQYK
ncbi:MAG: hypothetical protein MJZ46_06745 [Bacteroidales bacterium]|nr:hypothetical protein [Bacteroidales bacterium]